MGSRERDSTTTAPPPPHQHHLSSLVVRPAESGGGGSDYEPGEVRRDPPPYSRPDRFPDNSGHGNRAGSGSPMRHRKSDYHHNRSDFDSVPHRGRGFRGGRGPGRFRDSSPPYGRGRGGDRPSGRDFDGPGFGPGPFRGEGGMSRNNPNVSPREGDWICPDPSCGNLNFARREHCNNCNRLRIGPRDSPRRNYSGPPRFSGLPMDYSPGRGTNGYRSSPPPRGWGRDGPREFGSGPPHSRHGGRFVDHHVRRERPDFREEEDYRERAKFDRPMPPEWNHRGDRGRDNFKERRGFDGRNDRRPLSPPGPRRPLSPPGPRRPLSPPGPRRPLSPPGPRRPLSPPGPRRPLSPPGPRRPLSPPGPRRPLSPPGPRRPLSPPGPRRLLSPPGPRRPLSPPGPRRLLSPPGPRRPLSPPGPPPAGRGRWPRDTRERSRSPIRNGGPPMDYRRDSYMDRGRDSRWGMVRDRVDEPPF